MKTAQLIIIFILFFSIINFVSATDEPKLISVTDSLGNTQTSFYSNGGGGTWNRDLVDSTNPNDLFCSNCVIRIGDKITFTITANQENLEYKCIINGVFGEWFTSNICEWNVKESDYGVNKIISISVRNIDGLDYINNVLGDDTTNIAYKVVGVNDSIPVTNSSREGSGGNGGSITITNSSVTTDQYCSSKCLSWSEWSDCINNEMQRTCLQLAGNCSIISMPTQTQTCENQAIQVQVNQSESITESVTAVAEPSTGHTNITEACNGCLIEETCVSYGYRFNSTYCNLSKNFISQKQNEESCDNNFECGSNICASGKCVNAGLITMILNWFRHLFGFK